MINYTKSTNKTIHLTQNGMPACTWNINGHVRQTTYYSVQGLFRPCTKTYKRQMRTPMARPKKTLELQVQRIEPLVLHTRILARNKCCPGHKTREPPTKSTAFTAHRLLLLYLRHGYKTMYLMRYMISQNRNVNANGLHDNKKLYVDPAAAWEPLGRKLLHKLPAHRFWDGGMRHCLLKCNQHL